MKISKAIILLFMQLYCKKGTDKKGNAVAIMDHRNYGHGFFGTLIWAIIFLATAHFLNYQNWVLLGFVLATPTAFLAGVIWELWQSRTAIIKFSWRDVFASNFWFLPLYFVSMAHYFLYNNAYKAAEREFFIWLKEGKNW